MGTTATVAALRTVDRQDPPKRSARQKKPASGSFLRVVGAKGGSSTQAVRTTPSLRSTKKSKVHFHSSACIIKLLFLLERTFLYREWLRNDDAVCTDLRNSTVSAHWRSRGQQFLCFLGTLYRLPARHSTAQHTASSTAHGRRLARCSCSAGRPRAAGGWGGEGRGRQSRKHLG